MQTPVPLPNPAPTLPAGTKTLDITSERCRCYHYEGGKHYDIPYPVTAYILPNGSHRVVDEEGRTHRPTPGWLAISWQSKPGLPAFIA